MSATIYAFPFRQIGKPAAVRPTIRGLESIRDAALSALKGRGGEERPRAIRAADAAVSIAAWRVTAAIQAGAAFNEADQEAASDAFMALREVGNVATWTADQASADEFYALGERVKANIIRVLAITRWAE